MNRTVLLVLIGVFFLRCSCREPFAPRKGSIPFITYFASRYRGLCVGTLVSRTAVLTAAVCVTNPTGVMDTRPINVVCGTNYRHPRRGIRVQVAKVIIPNLINLTDNHDNRGYLMQKSAAVLLLKRKVPDSLTEVPMRAIEVDWRGDEKLLLQEECLTLGWHFFYHDSTIEPVYKFLLSRTLKVQFMNIVKKSLWCETLSLKFQHMLNTLGHSVLIEPASTLCLRDGMYGAPLVCRGKVSGVMMAPDAQWTNCTGFTNMMHIVSSRYLRAFMACVSQIFEVDEKYDWTKMKRYIHKEYESSLDYLDDIYDSFSVEHSSYSDEIKP